MYMYYTVDYLVIQIAARLPGNKSILFIIDTIMKHDIRLFGNYTMNSGLSLTLNQACLF